MSDNEKQAYYGKEWTKSMIPDVSIVILCYKTGERIRTFVDKVIRHDGMLRKFISEVYNLLFK
ncbi:MAG: hypothetical protein Q8O01_04100, partial [Candidatus Omnitrophota bacterium]|nr:hypothetical protein [Candidatus Omnitrophota bacterium]